MIDARRSVAESASFNRDSGRAESTSQYDMDRFKAALENQVKEFVHHQQPMIQAKSQQMQQLLAHNPRNRSLRSPGGASIRHTGVNSSRMTQPSAGKVSMAEVLESNRSLIREM